MILRSKISLLREAMLKVVTNGVRFEELAPQLSGHLGPSGLIVLCVEKVVRALFLFRSDSPHQGHNPFFSTHGQAYGPNWLLGSFVMFAASDNDRNAT